jgi:hypothetical protein
LHEIKARGVSDAAIKDLPQSPAAWRAACVIRTWTQLAWVTPEDDALLRLRSLRERMPADWDGKDRFARYRACGIEVSGI